MQIFDSYFKVELVRKGCGAETPRLFFPGTMSELINHVYISQTLDESMKRKAFLESKALLPCITKVVGIFDVYTAVQERRNNAPQTPRSLNNLEHQENQTLCL